MKLSWLLPGLLVGGGAAMGIVSDKVLGSEGKVILKGIPFQKQDRHQEGASIQSPSANAIAVDLDALNVALPNRTKSLITAQAREAPNPEQDYEKKPPVITLRTSNSAPPDTEDPPARRAEPSLSGEASTGASNGAAKTVNPASANRAIAGMGVGLVSVMLIFTIFL